MDKRFSKTTKADPTGQDPGSLQKVYECRTLLEYLAKKYDIKGRSELEEKTSEKIKAFLDLVEECQQLNSIARQGISDEEKLQQDLLHAIEFETNSKKRGPIDTKLHRCRVARRRYKDLFAVTDEIVQFFQEQQHKKTLDQMRQLLGRVRKIEKHQEHRIYNPRFKGEQRGQKDSV